MPAQTSQGNPQTKQWEYYTDMPVGEILRRARVHYGQSLNDVESALRIRASQLGSLEDGKLDDLPGRVYAIGFVRAYSEYLGLDGDKMVHLFKIQSVGNKARPELNFPVSASESKLPGLLLLGISFIAVIVIIVLFSIFHSNGSKAVQEDIPAVSPELKAEAQAPITRALPTLAVPQVAASLPAAPSVTPAQAGLISNGVATPAPTMAGIGIGANKLAPRIIINIKDTTWVEIRNSSGKAIISQVLNPGDEYIVPNEPGLVLATGNIGGLEFIADGAEIPPLGARGDVARGVKLDPDLMKSHTGQAMNHTIKLQPQPIPLPASVTTPNTAITTTPAMPTPANAITAAPASTTIPDWQSAIHSGQTADPSALEETTAKTPAPSHSNRKRLRSEDEAYHPARSYRDDPGPSETPAWNSSNPDD